MPSSGGGGGWTDFRKLGRLKNNVVFRGVLYRACRSRGQCGRAGTGRLYRYSDRHYILGLKRLLPQIISQDQL